MKYFSAGCLISVLLILTDISVNAQDVSWEWGGSAPVENTSDSWELLGNDDQGNIYMARTPPSVSDPYIWLEKFRYPDGLVKTYSVKRSIGDYNENMLLEQYRPVKDKVLLFYRGWSKSKSTSSYVLRTCSFEGEYKENDLVLDSYTAKNRMATGNYFSSVSPDRSKFAIISEVPYVKDANDKFKVAVYDAAGFQKLWEKDVEISIMAKKGMRTELLVDNEGTVFIYRRYNMGKEYSHHIIRVDKAGQVSDKQVDHQGNDLDESRFLFVNGSIYLAGLYSTSSYTYTLGSFAVKANPGTGEVESVKFNPFGERVTDNAKGVTYLRLKDVSTYSDGRILVMGEVGEKKMLSIVGNVTTYEYTTGNIVLSCLKPDLGTDWEANIGKSQKHQSSGLRWDSFTYGIVKDKLYIVYNNINAESEWKTPTGTMQYRSSFQMSGYPPFMYVVQDNGNVIYEDQKYGLPLFSLFKDLPEYSSVYPHLVHAGADALYIFAGKTDGKNIRIGKILYLK